MFAIIETGGKQYKVKKGLKLEIEKLDETEGKTVEFKDVLLVSDKGKVQIGKPLVEGAAVSAKILKQGLADKVSVFKMKAKKRYTRNRGFRQPQTTIEITEIKG